MFNKNVFTQNDPVADLIKGINEADYLKKMEALIGGQKKIDKNHNGKVDGDDFKILRGEKKAMKEEDTSVKIPTSSGTRVLGHRYGNAAKTHRDSMADPFAVVKGPGQKDIDALEKKKTKKEEIDPKNVTTDTLAGRVKGKTSNPFAPKKVMLDVPGNVNEGHKVSEQGVAEGAPIVVMPSPERLKKAEPTKVRYQGDIVPPTKPPSTEKRGVKGRPGQRPMPDQVVAEGDSQEPKGRMKSDGTRSHSTYGSRDNYKLGDPESSATSVKSKDFKKDALNILNQQLKKKDVAEGSLNEEDLDEAMNDNMHPAGAMLLKHIKPQHRNLYKPHLTTDTFTGSYKDRTDVLNAAKKAGHLNEESEEVESVDERTLSPAEKDAVEVNVKSMKKNLAGFKARYGKDAKSVMYATATKQAKKD